MKRGYPPKHRCATLRGQGKAAGCGHGITSMFLPADRQGNRYSTPVSVGQHVSGTQTCGIYSSPVWACKSWNSRIRRRIISPQVGFSPLFWQCQPLYGKGIPFHNLPLKQAAHGGLVSLSSPPPAQRYCLYCPRIYALISHRPSHLSKSGYLQIPECCTYFPADLLEETVLTMLSRELMVRGDAAKENRNLQSSTGTAILPLLPTNLRFDFP